MISKKKKFFYCTSVVSSVHRQNVLYYLPNERKLDWPLKLYSIVNVSQTVFHLRNDYQGKEKQQKGMYYHNKHLKFIGERTTNCWKSDCLK